MKTLLLGDMSPTETNNELFKENKLDKLLNDAISLFEGNDETFVNLEVALTESNGAIKKYGPNLKATPNAVECFKPLNITVYGLSNNHIFDFGKQGALDTIQTITKAGIAYTGFGDNYEDSRKNYIATHNGEKVAFIAVCEHEFSYALDDRMGSRPYDPYDTMEDIRKAKAENDRVIVLYHGGKEYCKYPSPRLMKVCRAMVKNGADVVLCQHTHCISCYENYEGGHILYGQGNFHFVKPTNVSGYPECWFTCLAVKYDTKENKIDFIPLVTEGPGMRLANEAESKEIFAGFEERNRSLQDGTWIEGWRAFCESKRDVYEDAVLNGTGTTSAEIPDSLFAHYLDCEAHHDVWCELFKTANWRNER